MALGAGIGEVLELADVLAAGATTAAVAAATSADRDSDCSCAWMGKGGGAALVAATLCRRLVRREGP